MARIRYLSDLINTHTNRPKILFATFNSVINPSCHYKVAPSGEICDKFLCFFLDKIKTIRSSLDKSPVANVRPLVIVSNVLSSFQHVSLPALSDMVSGMRPSSCPHDIVPAIVLKSSFTSLGFSIFLICICFL